ncbi:MAG: hypothetical protein KJ574_02270 [Nanoarchaeota archaeon]|nr:hypothetical protein [Nanoarchaeota archaeon]
MVAIPLLLNVIADVLALLILIYVTATIAFSQKSYQKEEILLRYESLKRDKVFRKSLIILGFSVFCALIATVLSIAEEPSEQWVNLLQFMSSILRMGFFLYLMLAVSATKH